MKPRKRISKLDVLIIISILTCLLLITSIAMIQPLMLLPIMIILLVITVLILVKIRSFHKLIARILHDGYYNNVDVSAQKGLLQLGIPVVAVAKNTVLWYNKAFKDTLLNSQDITIENIYNVLPQYSLEEAKNGVNIECNNEMYTLFHNDLLGENEIYFIYLIKDTKLKQIEQEYKNSRPSVMIIAIDTYDEILKEMKESDKAKLTSKIDNALEQFIGNTSGILKRTSASRYLAIVEERHMQEIIKSRFTILDNVRQLTKENASVSLSIGVGHDGDTLKDCETMAMQALDMALGRGGDQAAVKSKDGIAFFGGVLHSVENNSRVRSRIIANALKELMRQSDNIVISGHKMSDLDSVGAAAGVYRFAKACDKPACIVINDEKTMAKMLIDRLREEDVEFIHPDGAENLIGKNTLVVIVDTHLKALIENPKIYEIANNVVVIDHHRLCVGYIEDSVIFYHEPSCSSASEMVAELLQYIQFNKSNKITQGEAQAMLAGIMLDTRNFAVHTGVRTFEASAFLRRMGAQTAQTKMLFNSSFEHYINKSELVKKAEIYKGCAIVATELETIDYNEIIPQAANDLLTINGVSASFVAVKHNEKIMISARSMGEVNVQVIMEKLGGGGHLTMAATQMRNTSIEDAKQMLIHAIEEYETKEKTESRKSKK